MNNHKMRTYTAYGYSNKTLSPSSILEFNGEPADVFTGFYILGAGYRAYWNYLMRFLSPDSLSPFYAGGINAYCYCANDPINSADPSGHVGVRLTILRRQQKPMLQSRSQILAQLDSPAQVNTSYRRDAPPYLTTHPHAFSTSGTPPSYDPGTLPSYSKRLPAGHKRLVTPTLSPTGKFVEQSKPPSYERPKLLQPPEIQKYRAELEEINSRHKRLKMARRELKRRNLYIPDYYRRDINELRSERTRIRELLAA
ncbi:MULTISPECIES: RHS repeat-associated core domain-containing protein [Pseudomonas]|uniref:RHS repeat-associated core domain-containing protein n=1 Tax=Pseudomonas TaxID=286 RepID=UPI001F0F11B5|nr:MULTISPECIES: RHS repeat-associated core domain-containing protein [Pseudomonas]